MINDEFNYPSWLYDPQLVIPATFEECLTYEMQVIWLYKKIEALGDGGGSDAIKQLQDEVAALAVRVDKNSQDITESKADIVSLEDEIGNLRVTVESYDERINNAITLAQGADRTATIATNTANEAKETAAGIKATADEALANAATATETATEAKNTADSVKSTADSAVTTANTAKTTADEAKVAAASAEETADSALSNISTVMSAVNRAQKTADNAAAAAANLGTSKQDKLVAGDNINIDGNVISATGGGGGGTSNYYELQNRPFLQEIDLSTTTTDAPFDLKTLSAGTYMLKGDGYVNNSTSANEYREVHGGPMFLYPSESGSSNCDAVFITTVPDDPIEPVELPGLYSGSVKMQFYRYDYDSIYNLPQVITDGCVVNNMSGYTRKKYLPTTQAVADYVRSAAQLSSSKLIKNLRIPIAGTNDEDNLLFVYWFNETMGRFVIQGVGAFTTTASMEPSITTIEIGPLTKDEFLAFCTYKFNPPDHVVIYSFDAANNVPYAMYWYDKVDPASTDKQWTWKYQFNASKSLYQGITGADALVTLPVECATVYGYAIF